MDISRILLDILVVLVAAKAAAEVSERIGVPAVVGEMLAGILLGPSVLGWVGRSDEVLRSLGEIGVILLLLDVGLEMDIGELRRVGRSAVATVGVIVPMVLGILAMQALGAEFNTALFVGAALTATSVGITARVFGDLRALATTEARIVLGAAVADDVMGLVVLTVVVRLVTQGSVSVLSILGIVGLAVGFLVMSGAVGIRLAPPLFRAVSRLSRSGGTLVALAFAFTLAFAELANAAKLAPIVGAFVAGLALTRSDQAERIRSELAPVGHLFIPIFFLQIGIDAEVEAFARVAVLRDASILLAVAVLGKLVASAGALGGPGDKLLIGLGMLPRGEVGLIFATIGLASGVLNDDLYASLLLVVLVTTLVTPPLLKQRYRVIAGRDRAGPAAVAGEADTANLPVPGLVLAEGEVRLASPAPNHGALTVALRAALLARHASPSADLLTWLAALPEGAAAGWSPVERELLIDVVEQGNARSWRFLESVGILDRALPELAQAMRRRRGDPFELDPDAGYRWRALERLRVLDQGDLAVQEARRLADPGPLLLGALLVEALDSEPDPEGATRRLLDRIGLEHRERDEVFNLVADRGLYWAAARRAGAFSEVAVVQLAGHFGSAERARASYVLAALQSAGHERWEQIRLTQLHDLVQDVLSRGGASEGPSRSPLEQRRSEVVGLVGDDPVAVARATSAPSAFLLGVEPATAARLVRTLDPLPSRREVRVDVEPGTRSGHFEIAVASRDRAGLLAAMASTLMVAELDVVHAKLATWSDGAVLEWFEVAGEVGPDADRLAALTREALAAPPSAGPLHGVLLEFDDKASPWHTVCEVSGPAELGLLAALATVFRAAGAAVRSATIDTHEGVAYDVFELTDPNGRKLETEVEQTICRLAEEGVVLRRGLFRQVVVERPDTVEQAAS